MESETPQLILVGVILVLTTVLEVLGVQIFLILRQSRETLKKVNKILDGTSSVVGNASLFSHPLVKILLGSALTFFSGQKKIKAVKEIKETYHGLKSGLQTPMMLWFTIKHYLTSKSS